MPEPLQGARLKLERAKHHINDLNRHAEKFFASGAYEVTVDDNAQTNQRSVCVKAYKPVPIDLALIIGDAIHNMRAALDLMTWEVIIPFKPKSLKNLMFPVGNNGGHFLKNMFPNRQIDIASPKIIRAFADLEVYPGGYGDNLWRVHHLDVTDKHQILMPAISTAALAGFNPNKIDPGFFAMWKTTPASVFFFYGVESQNLVSWPLQPTSVSIAQARRNFKDYTNRYKTLQIAFGAQAEPYAMGLVVPKLLEFARTVDDAINIMAAALV